jgi:predicted secreted protein
MYLAVVITTGNLKQGGCKLKSKLVLMGIVVIVSLLFVGCSPGGKQISVDCEDFQANNHISKEIEVSAGDSLKVTLCSNPTTGFEWEQAQISDQSVLQQTSHEFVAPSEGDNPPPPGTPGQEIWIFDALNKGTSTV